jgi:hypothetical protein
MEPSDTDGRAGGETPGEMLFRLIEGGPEGNGPYTERYEDGQTVIDGWVNLDAIAAAFKAAVLAGEV